MIPTLFSGDYILVNKYIYKYKQPQRGDVIVFVYPKDPSKDFIKRVVGLEGDVIEIKDKQIFINGQKHAEDYIFHSDPNILHDNINPRDNFGPVKVPEDSLFTMGDNRDHSYDSRHWGFVKKSKVKGKAINIYWSWDKDQYRVRWNRIGERIQ